MIKATEKSTIKKPVIYPGMMRTYGVDDVRYGGKSSHSYFGKGLARLIKTTGNDQLSHRA